MVVCTVSFQKPTTKGFLNVVDIDSADLLKEISASVPERQPHEVEPQAVDMEGKPIQPKTILKHTESTPQDMQGQ